MHRFTLFTLPAVVAALAGSAIAAPLELPGARLTLEVAGDPWLVGPSPGANKDMILNESLPSITILVAREPGPCIDKIVNRLADLDTGRSRLAEPTAHVPRAWFPIELSMLGADGTTPIKLVCRDLATGSIAIGMLTKGAFDDAFWTRSAPVLAAIEAQLVATGEPPKTYDVTGAVMIQRFHAEVAAINARRRVAPTTVPPPASQPPAPPSVRPASLTDFLNVQFSVVASRAHLAATAEDDASAVGIQAGFEGSFYTVLTRQLARPRRGFRIRDSWTAAFGTGYSSVADHPGWFTFRLEAGLRPVYQVSDNLDVFSRLVYLVGYDTNRQVACLFTGSGCKGFDDYLITGGFRAGKLFVEVGYGTPRNVNSGQAGYSMATLQYRLRESGAFKYVGVHYEGTSSDSSSDPSTKSLRVVFASH